MVSCHGTEELLIALVGDTKTDRENYFAEVVANELPRERGEIMHRKELFQLFLFFSSG